MSMIGWVQALSSAQIAALRAKPSRAEALAFTAEEANRAATLDEVLNGMPPEQREAAQARRRAQAETPGAKALEAQRVKMRAEIDPFGPFEPAVDLEKSWHMLHYLFTGHVDEANAPGNALLTGEEIGGDVGYGPCRLHDVAATAVFAEFLTSLDVARLQARVNYRAMSQMQVYAMPRGRGSDAEFEGELRTEVGFYFPRLRDYVAATAARHGGLLIWIS